MDRQHVYTGTSGETTARQTRTGTEREQFTAPPHVCVLPDVGRRGDEHTCRCGIVWRCTLASYEIEASAQFANYGIGAPAVLVKALYRKRTLWDRIGAYLPW